MSKKQYTDIFIDFDDTLYDTHGNADIALREVFGHFHLERFFPDPQVFYKDYWQTNIDLWAQYAHGDITRDFLIVERFRHPLALGNGLEPTREQCLEVSNVFLDFCSNKPGVVEGAHQLMDYLKSRGYRLHMCSNGFHEVQYKKLRACGLSDYFDTIILSEDAGVNKPAAQYFDYAFSRSKAPRKTTIMIGDSLTTDIQGAINAGIDTIYFNRWPEYPSSLPVNHEVKMLSEIMHIL